MSKTPRDQNGETVTQSIRQERVNGRDAWGVFVWFGYRPATNVTRYYYETREQARASDISDDVGKRGRVHGPVQ